MSGKLRVDEGSLVWTETVVRCYRGEVENSDEKSVTTYDSVEVYTA